MKAYTGRPVNPVPLFLGLAREWSDAPWTADSLQVRDAGGAPVAGAAVTLGRALVLESDALGWVRFARTEPGPMLVTVEHARGSTETVLIDSSRGVRLTLPSAP